MNEKSITQDLLDEFRQYLIQEEKNPATQEKYLRDVRAFAAYLGQGKVTKGGVNFIRGKFVAKLVFQKKQYFLGQFDNLDDAALARRDAEETLNGTIVVHYAKWTQRAAGDPGWAEANPVRFQVEQDEQRRLKVICLPLL